jgi:hypothetical protein
MHSALAEAYRLPPTEDESTTETTTRLSGAAGKKLAGRKPKLAGTNNALNTEACDRLYLERLHSNSMSLNFHLFAAVL